MSELYHDSYVEIAYHPDSEEIHLLSLKNGVHPKKMFVLPQRALEKLATCRVDTTRDAINGIDHGILPALEEYNISPEYISAAASRAYIEEQKVSLVIKIHQYLETL